MLNQNDVACNRGYRGAPCQDRQARLPGGQQIRGFPVGLCWRGRFACNILLHVVDGNFRGPGENFRRLKSYFFDHPAMKFCIFLFLMLALSASHQGAAAHGQWKDRSPDQRQQIREQMREHWQQGGERSAYAPEHRQGGARWREMPQEDRRRLREEMRGRPVPDYAPDRRPPGG